MDFLPQISYPAFPPLKVPFLCSDCNFDGGEFLTFPSRRGWDLLRQEGDLGQSVTLVRKDGFEPSILEMAKITQAWLFFGFLVETFRIVEIKIDTADYIHKVSGEECLVTAQRLPGAISAWLTQESQLPTYIQGDHSNRVTAFLQDVGAIIDGFLSFPRLKLDTSNEDSITLAVIAQSVSVLGDALFNAAQHISRPQTEAENLSTFRTLRRFVEPAVLSIARLKSNGWCISERMMLRQYTDGTGLYFASMLRRDAMIGKHDQCSTYECLATQIDEQTYSTRHTTTDCDCSPVVMDGRALASILRQGGVPCVRLGFEDHGQVDEMQVHVIEQPKEGYIAISHVWAHGLGNPTSNSLPRCQLERLCKLALALKADNPRKGHTDHDLDGNTSKAKAQTTSVTIWIDTLCIPTNAELYEDRKLAIIRLSDTFREASAVLVLDAELQAVSIEVSRLELEIRLLTCAWMRRLWTLQEGLEAQPGKLYWQLKERAVEDSRLLTREQASLHGSYYTEGLQRRLPSGLRSNSNDHDHDADADRLSSRLLSAMNALRYRTTSKAEDETLCLAPILRLPRDRLLKTNDATERMKVFLAMWPQIPKYFLFFEGARIEQDGCRWMPQSFLSGNHKSVIQRTDHEMTTYDGRGLYVTFPGLIFTAPDEILHIHLEVGFLNPMNAQWYSVRDTGPIFESSLPATQRWKHWRTQLHILRRPAIIVEYPTTKENDYLIGILISIVDDRDGKIFARYLCRIRLLPRFPDSSHTNMEDELRKDLVSRLNSMSTEADTSAFYDFPPTEQILNLTSTKQMWCVG